MNDARPVAEFATLGEHVAALADVARKVGEPLGPDEVLGGALRAIPHADRAGLTVLGARGRPETWVATDDLPSRIDALAHALGEGPFEQAVGGADVVRVGDVTADAGCSTFGPQCAAEFGVRSIVSVRVEMSGAERGALSFYAAEPAVFDEADVRMAVVFAPLAGLAVQNAIHARKVEQLEIALQSSRQIGTAVGILMARHLLTGDEAFARMSRASQQLNRKLREIAEWVERTGTLPGMPEETTISDGLITD